MTTKFIEPTNDHIGKMVEVKDYTSCEWEIRELAYVLPEKFANRFVCVSSAFEDRTVNWDYARIPAPKTYAELQTESGLKVGDWVKVTRAAKSYENGWGTMWQAAMDQYVGETYKIYEISDVYGMSFGYGGFFFPYFVLEKTEKPETKEEKIDKLIRLFKEELVKIL